jgi:hypothetical protein
MQSIASSDMDLLTTMMLDPDTVSIEEQRSAASKLGVKGGMLSAMVNTFTDPVVWLGYLMHRTFPSKSFLLGTVDKRFVGAANEFSGISAVTRTVENFWRGTNIPRMSALAVRRKQEVINVGNKIWDKILKRPNWQEEMPTVSLLLEGVEVPATAGQIKLKNEIRQHMDEIWGMLGQAQKVRGGFGGTEIAKATSEAYRASEAPKYLRNYLPHIPLNSNNSIMEISGADALKRTFTGKQAMQTIQAKGINPLEVWTPLKSDTLASEFSRYQNFLNQSGAGVFNMHLFHRKRFNIPVQGLQGQELFVSDLNQILHRYIHSAAQTYSMNAPISNFERVLAAERGAARAVTNEPLAVQIINEGLENSGAKMMRRQIPGTQVIRETLVPGSENPWSMASLKTLVRNLQGQTSLDEQLWGNMASSIRHKMSRATRNLVGAKQQHEMNAAMSTLERDSSYRNWNSRIASYFYSTTLGLNPFSAFQNMLQPGLTTIPAIGVGATMQGYKVLSQRLPQYSRNVIAEHRALTGGVPGIKPGGRTVARLNEATERAFYKTFPELKQQGFKIDPRLFDLDESQLLAGKFRRADAWGKFLLQPFTHSELSNQIVSFYGARNALNTALRTGEYALPKGLSAAQARDMIDFDSGLLVNATQFRPGPGSRTLFQSILPAPLRQFSTFPVRLANFFSESTVRGAMTQAQLEQASVMNVLAGGEAGQLARQKLLSLGTGRNMGTIGRTLLTGRIATEGAREVLGVDLGGSLGITAPYLNVAPNAVLGVLPMPPVLDVVQDSVSFATTRDIKRLQPMHLPGIGPIPVPKTLVPGGIGISRAVRAMQQWRPDLNGFVDDNERLMYEGSTTDLLLSMFGIPLEKERRMRDAMDRIYANRRSIRNYRREYSVAAMNYDYTQMDKLRVRFNKAFPDLPPLSVSENDLRRYRESRRIPLVSRMARTLGSQSRYLEAEIYKHDPELVAAPSLAGF